MILKNKILLTVLLLFFGVSSYVYADYNSYEINNYKVDINVLENGIVEITEILIVDFDQERHGIYREIPLKGTIERKIDKKLIKSKYTLEISDVCVQDYKYSEYIDGSNYIIKIGDEDCFVTGRQTYTISYKIHMQDYTDSSLDEFYFNIIGTGWNTIIHNAELTVSMPSAFDENKVYITSGPAGVSVNKYTEYSVVDNTIYIKTTKELRDHMGVTVRVELEDGYFKYAEKIPLRIQLNDIDSEYFIMLAAVMFMFIIWYNYGKSPKPDMSNVSLPPKDMTPAEMGYIFDGRVDDKDVISLLFFWAVKGYIKIEELSDNDYKIQKVVKQPKFENNYEAELFYDLFEAAFKNEPSRKSITIKQIKLKLHKITNKAKRSIIEKYNSFHGGIFTKSSVIIKRIALSLCALPYFLGISKITRTSTDFMGILIVTYIAGSIFLYYGFKYLNEILVSGIKNKSTRKILNGILFPVYIIFPFFFMYKTLYKFTYNTPFIIGILVTIFIIGILAGNMEKPTDKTMILREKILSLRKFMQNAKSEDLKDIAADNEQYFYDILPFAYVLDLTSVWSKKFEDIVKEFPGWYHADTMTGRFSMPHYGRIFNSIESGISTGTMPGGVRGGSGGGMSGGGGGSW